MHNDLIQEIKDNIEKTEFENGGYKLVDTHFENGKNLHSNQYYFAKRYFQNTENCKNIATLFVDKLDALEFDDSTTLVGFRNYTALLLSQVITISGKYNYAIIEQGNGEGAKDDFFWQHLPSLNKNLVIVIPITCTCSTFIKLRKWLLKEFTRTGNTWCKVNDNFINVFLILEKSLEHREDQQINIPLEKENNKKVFDIYSSFNWNTITDIQTNQIIFNNKSSVSFTANPLIRLYSEIYLPESCPFCFPEVKKNEKERPLFPTHDNYETPNLIFGFPNFSKTSTQQDFFKTFIENDKPWNIQLYGHIEVNKNNYIHYIRGNAFYEKNRHDILHSFELELSKYIDKSVSKIIFITSENKHNSSFLEDVTLIKSLSAVSVTILRFEPTNEFVDNFISLYSKVINEKNTLLIYFQEVISSGTTLKLISDYIKHTRIDDEIIGRPGFDLVFTLVDRTLQYTRNEIIKKIFSVRISNPGQRFISFFKLNVPIFSASHLGNPLKARIGYLNGMVKQCHLDSLKMKVIDELEKHAADSLPEKIDTKDLESHRPSFFPFGNIEIKYDLEICQIYQPYFDRERVNLLKLYLAHEINTLLSSDEFQTFNFEDKYKNRKFRFIEDLIERVRTTCSSQLENYFINSKFKNSKRRDTKIENEIIHDNIVKLLTRHPFVYYKIIYESVFDYCLYMLDNLHTEIEKVGIQKFGIFRRLKFYIRRSIDLNSNFIISSRFLKCIKEQYNKQNIDKIIDSYEQIISRLRGKLGNKEIDEDYFALALGNVVYKRNQVSSYFLWLLYCFKELVYKNPYRSIRLEGLINSPELLPGPIVSPNNSEEEMEGLLHSPYYHLTGMIKAENVYLLHELKDLHKGNYEDNYFVKRSDYKEYYFTGNQKNDPIIINAQKLLGQSRYQNIQNKHKRRKKINEIKDAISAMLRCTNILEEKSKKSYQTEENEFTHEINEILDRVVKIVSAGINNHNLKCGFFIEYRRRTGRTINTDNIYSLISGQTIDDSEIKLRKDGLVYNLLYGLKDKNRAEQSLLFAVKMYNDKIVSFDNDYYSASLDETLSFEALYNNDCFDVDTGTGLKLLTEANMILAIRLSKLKHINLNRRYRLFGQAVILITSDQIGSTDNFLDFMSNEKVRLLQIVKDDLLDYLEKQFSNDAFIEVLENKKRALYQKHLRHGLSDYLKWQKELMTRILNKVKIRESEAIFNIVTDAIRGQLLATKKEDIFKKEKYTRDKILDVIGMMFANDLLGKIEIPYNQLRIEYFDFDFLELPISVYTIIIPELIINMKKYCPRTNAKGLSIEFTKTTNEFHFKNYINQDFEKLVEKGSGQGLKMCNDILRNLGWEVLSPQSNDFVHQVTLKIK